ncbi:hypothetical protein GBA52_002334 [Prunus armeniaca]|nr:hypothetical protein GBA52_002334 [Prunus armeniaca]
MKEISQAQLATLSAPLNSRGSVVANPSSTTSSGNGRVDVARRLFRFCCCLSQIDCPRYVAHDTVHSLRPRNLQSAKPRWLGLRNTPRVMFSRPRELVVILQISSELEQY